MLHAVPGLGQAFGELLVNAGDGPALIINRDPINTLIIGNEQTATGQGMRIGAPVSVIDPLGFMAVDGTEDLYGQGTQTSGTLTVDVKHGATAALLTQLIAQAVSVAVSAAGVPPIDAPTAISILINQNIAAGASFSTPQLSVGKYQSWFATMASGAGSAGTGTNPFTKCTMAWSVASDNNDPLIVHDYVIPNTPFNFFYNYRNDGQGPILGDSLQVTWKNYDSQPTNIIFGLFGSFRTRIRSKFVGRYHWNTDGTPDESRGLGSDGIATIYTPSVPIAPGFTSGGSLMNLMDGPAVVFANIVFAAAGAANYQIDLTPQPQTLVSTTISIQNLGTASAPGLGNHTELLPPTPVMLPRRVCTIDVTNNHDSASNITFAQVTVIAQEQPE